MDVATDAVIILADLQAGIVERARTVNREELSSGIAALAQLASIFDMPVIVTAVAGEDGGPAVLIPEIETALGSVRPMLRTTTSIFDNAAIVSAIRATRRRLLVIAGVATEVVVQRASLAAVREGFEVQVVLDACGGINARSEQASMYRLVQAGVVLTSVPSLAGELAADFTQPKAQQALGVLMRA